MSRAKGSRRGRIRLQHRFGNTRPPGPLVAEPELRDDVERRRRATAVGRGDAHQDVFLVVLGVFDADVEVRVVVEDARIDQLVLGVEFRALLVGCEQVGVRECALRVLIQCRHVRVRRDVVEVVVLFLNVLAVVALMIVETVKAFLENRIGAVPKSRCEAEMLVVVADSEDAVLAPAIRARACVFEGEVVPRRTVSAVVLAHGAPLTVAEVRSPMIPVLGTFPLSFDPGPLGVPIHTVAFS